MRENCEAHSRLVSRGVVGPNPVNTVVIDLAFGIVAAEDSDAERIAHVVSLDDGHRHLGEGERAKRRAADPVVTDPSVGEMGHDPFAAADHSAVLHDARRQVETEGDVDALRILAGRRMDETIADRDR